MNDVLHSSSSSREWHRDALVEPLGEYLSRAVRPRASRAADHDLDLDASAVRRQIGQKPLVPTMDLPRNATATRASGRSKWRSRNGDDLVRSNLDVFNSQTGRRQRMAVTIPAHLG
jgi:hypothetical protein